MSDFPIGSATDVPPAHHGREIQVPGRTELHVPAPL